MIRVALAALAFLAIFAATAHAQTKPSAVVDGTCSRASTTTGDLAAAVQQANGDCLPETSAARPGAEAREMAALKDSYHRWITQECARKLCMNNLWGFIEDAYDTEYFYSNILAGCGEWASRSALALNKVAPKYWSVREVEYGREPEYGRVDRYHWAVELENTRTGEIVVVDGYRAAAKARSWVFWSPGSSNENAISKADETGPQSDETSTWGAPAKSPCANTNSLCNPKPCKV